MVGWWHPSTSAFACALAHGLGLWHLLIEAESALLLKGGCGMGWGVFVRLDPLVRLVVLRARQNARECFFNVICFTA